MEDDYDSIDGIINNGAKEDPEEAIRAEQKSVKEKIHENEEKLKSQIYEPTMPSKFGVYNSYIYI
jgi:hypothetical protein